MDIYSTNVTECGACDVLHSTPASLIGNTPAPIVAAGRNSAWSQFPSGLDELENLYEKLPDQCQAQDHDGPVLGNKRCCLITCRTCAKSVCWKICLNVTKVSVRYGLKYSFVVSVPDNIGWTRYNSWLKGVHVALAKDALIGADHRVLFISTLGVDDRGLPKLNLLSNVDYGKRNDTHGPLYRVAARRLGKTYGWLRRQGHVEMRELDEDALYWEVLRTTKSMLGLLSSGFRPAWKGPCSNFKGDLIEARNWFEIRRRAKANLAYEQMCEQRKLARKAGTLVSPSLAPLITTPSRGSSASIGEGGC